MCLWTVCLPLLNGVFVDREKTGGNGIVLCLETEDVEAAVAKAVHAGAVKEGEVVEGEGGGLVVKVKDPYGFIWQICSPVKASAEVAA